MTTYQQKKIAFSEDDN